MLDHSLMASIMLLGSVFLRQGSSVNPQIVALSLSVLVTLSVSDLDAQRITRRESRGEVHNRVSVSSIVATIDGSPRVASRVRDLATLSPDQVRVVDVRPFISRAGRPSYTAALERRAKDVQALRTALIDLDAVVRVLTAQKPVLTVDDVVAAGVVDVIETGRRSNALVLYVDRQNTVGLVASPESQSRSAPVSFQATTATLMAALQTAPEMVARVSAINSLRLDRVRFIDIDALLKPADVDTYRAAVRENESALRLLRAELSKRPLVMHALERHDAKLMLGDIFAADILGNDDALIIYFRRPSKADTAGSQP